MQHPFYKWKNLVVNPNIIIRKNSMQFNELYYKIEEMIKFLTNFMKEKNRSDKELKNNLKTINSQKSKATGKKTKKNEKIMKDLGSLMLRQKTLLEQQKKAIDSSKRYSKDVTNNINDLMDASYNLFIAAMTLLHRERDDADKLIQKIRSLKHTNEALLEQHKEHSIRFLNEVKKEVREVAKKMYATLQYQERGVSNPLAALKEISPMSTRIKCRRVRQATIEIDNYESLVQQQMKVLKVNQIPHLVHDSWIPQIKVIEELVEDHIAILSHRVHKMIHHIIKNKKLKDRYKNKLKGLARQARWLMNSIEIKEYKSKIIPFPKQKEQEIIKKVA